MSSTIMAFDFGMKRIGVAVGQTITRSANPVTTLSAKEGVPDWIMLDKLIATWRPTEIVVGIPLNMDGTDQAMTNHARAFAKALQARYQISVHESDERLTTKSAREAIFSQGGYKALRKKPIDSMAAKIILEHWLDQKYREQ